MADQQPAIAQLEAATGAVQGLPSPQPMTREEYEENRRRLEVYAADAKRAYLQEKAAYDGICEELQSLRDDWDEQQRNQTTTEQ